MIQNLIIVLLFIAALGYLGRLVYKNFQAKSNCSSGCGSCGIDFSKIQKDLERKASR
jgi:hypothetical protein